MKVVRCLVPEKWAASEALWLLPVPEAVSFCSVHSHVCRLLSAESQIPLNSFNVQNKEAFFLTVSVRVPDPLELESQRVGSCHLGFEN